MPHFVRLSHAPSIMSKQSPKQSISQKSFIWVWWVSKCVQSRSGKVRADGLCCAWWLPWFNVGKWSSTGYVRQFESVWLVLITPIFVASEDKVLRDTREPCFGFCTTNANWWTPPRHCMAWRSIFAWTQSPQMRLLKWIFCWMPQGLHAARHGATWRLLQFSFLWEICSGRGTF